eukprot:3342915-Prymnesium_polylepis.3
MHEGAVLRLTQARCRSTTALGSQASPHPDKETPLHQPLSPPMCAGSGCHHPPDSTARSRELETAVKRAAAARSQKPV